MSRYNRLVFKNGALPSSMGRNGLYKTSGLDFDLSEEGKVLLISGVTSKNMTANGYVALPTDSQCIKDFLNTLREVVSGPSGDDARLFLDDDELLAVFEVFSMTTSHLLLEAAEKMDIKENSVFNLQKKVAAFMGG